MGDIIQLLPNTVADQIAAGEVVQRPASVVKELLENSVDAGATDIKLVIKKAGKTLIQVTDNGCGMSGTDARMAFERHATSKIRNADDLFAIKTKGFRGEALASIAAISQVDVKSRLTGEELGSHLAIDGSQVTQQEPCSCATGTTIMIKNLFFNVPARRNFLKSDAVEIKHIIEEFERIALAHPDVHFSMYNEKNLVHDLPRANFRQRIVNTFGKKYDQRLVPVEEKTDLVRIRGFVTKPEYARKTRGEQYFFVNDRFIKNYFLDHAVRNAFHELIPSGHYPSYFLYFQIDPSRIDINIHPTKTEIKFQDEKALHAIIEASVKQALGQHNISPTLDFEQETSFNVGPPDKNQVIRPPEPDIDPDYNPFEEGNGQESKGSKPSSGGGPTPSRERVPEDWEKLYNISRDPSLTSLPEEEVENGASRLMRSSDEERHEQSQPPYQLHQRYIISHIRSGLIVTDQQRAHERILYEQFLHALEKQQGASQQQLFPQKVELGSSDLEMLRDMQEEMNAIGLDISEFGKDAVVVNGIPAAAATETNVKDLLEELLEQVKNQSSDPGAGHRERIALALARSMAIRPGHALSVPEMNDLIDRLFACEVPYFAPGNRPTIVTFTLQELAKRFDT